MRALAVAVLLAASAWTGTARADIPTTDAAQLTQRSQTSSTTIKLVPITTSRQTANQGVNCSVTTGKRANVTDPTVQPQAGAGRRTIQPYAPDMPTAPAPGAQGGALGSQTLFGSAGDVVEGLDASRSTMGAASSAFRAAGQQVGSAPTVMGALDMNSGSRVQNNLAWNGTIGSANLWVQALNALNLARTGDASRASTGMRSSLVPAANLVAALACPAGTIGTGTAADPCRSPTGSCAASSSQGLAGLACTTATFQDGAGNVLFASLPAGNVPADATSGSQPMSLADAIAALSAQPYSTP